MPIIIGKNRNTTDTVTTTTVTINSVTATKILDANPDRLWARVCIDSGGGIAEAFIREYAAATDNIKKGQVISRTASNQYTIYETFIDTIYTGELSAITVGGSFDVHVMEG